MKILILHGPNLNMLGRRDPSIYGNETLDEIGEWIKNHKLSTGCSFIFNQSNHEGEIINFIHSSINLVDAVIINAGAYSHYSIAIRDAIELIDIPVIEVHISDTNNREKFRKISMLSDVCVKQIIGIGKRGYIEAIDLLVKNYD